ncbi:MAG: hypothetical protein VB096_08990 [Pseudoflavonifractor sp.]|nr:hypothetical protein [Pseudoflavonifractor sp.]
MLDLNATMFYKAKFTISSVDSSDDLLWETVLEIRSWMIKKWNYRDKIVLSADIKKWTALKNGGRIFSEAGENDVYMESEFYNPSETDKEYWACRITERRPPQAGVAPRQWVTEVGYEQEKKGKAIFSCVITYSDAAGFIGEYEETPAPSLPKLIANLIANKKLACRIGFDDVSLNPKELKAGDWPDFWKRIISKERACPYVYISPKRITSESDEVELLIPPDTLANTICGNAIVFFSKDYGFTKEMSYLGPEEYVCYGGAIRVYQPDIKIVGKEDSYHHRFLSASYISEVEADHVLIMLRRALAQNVHFYDSFFRVDECRKKKDESSRRQRLAEIQEQHRQALNKIQDQKLDEAVEEEQKRLEAEEREADLQLEIDGYKQDIYNLSSQVEAFRAAAGRCRELEDALASRLEVQSIPETQLDVIMYFKTTFGDKLGFTDDAMKSLKDCTIPIADLWNVLYALATIMNTLVVSDNIDPYKEFQRQTGINCSRGEGRMTRKDKILMRQFLSQYKGETIDIESHITFPRMSQSIHFGYSNAEQKIVIGHCGEHLDIYSTQKRK